MIDKSIRQYYQDGEKVKKLGYEAGKKLISPSVDESGLIKNVMEKGTNYIDDTIKNLDPASLAQSGAKRAITNFAAKKLGLGSLFGIPGMILGWLYDKAVNKFTGEDTGDGITGVMDAFTGKLKAPGSQAQWEADKELRILEKRKDDMWNRMLENKPYSIRKKGRCTQGGHSPVLEGTSIPIVDVL